MRMFIGWSDIKSFAGNSVIKISYVVVIGFPIVIEILKGLGVTYKYPNTVFEIFYSGIILIVSYLLYAVFAPKEIKEHKSMNEYRLSLRDYLANSHPDKIVNIVLAHLDPSQNGIREQIIELLRRISVESDPVRKAQLEKQLVKLVRPYVQS